MGSSVGPMILRTLLTETLKNRWSIAMYIPVGRAQFTESDKRQSGRISSMVNNPSRTTELSEQELQDEKEWMDRLESLILQDMRQLFRARFRQVSDRVVIEECSNAYVYTTPDILSNSSQYKSILLSHEEAMQMPILRPQRCDAPTRTPQETALFDFMFQSALSHKEKTRQIATDQVESLQNFEAQVRQKLEELVASSEDKTRLVISSCAIHACAFCLVQPCIQFLLDLLPPDKKKESLDHPDIGGLTPLMVAAGSQCNGEFDERKRYEICNFLIQQGANKHVQNRSGLTALGFFRAHCKSNNDFAITFGLAGRLQVNGRHGVDLESLLMPATGPSPADEQVNEEDSEEIDDNDDY